MFHPKISAKLTAKFWEAFRQQCHRFIAIGYQQALARIQNEPDQETHITGYICEAIKDWFLANPKESQVFFVIDDPVLSDGKRRGKARLKADIIISYAAGARPEFFFEAKRLHKKKAPAVRYIGNEGMGCFISERYASKWQEAGMIGYVQSDTLDFWQVTLQEKVEADSQNLEVAQIEKQVSFSQAFPLEWTSTHRRKQTTPIRLFHILLACHKKM